MRWALVATVSISLVWGKEPSTLGAARAAAEMLGPDTWSRVLEVKPRKSAQVIYALVFEFAGLLWLYDPRQGTESFSLHRGRLQAEKEDFAPLVAAIFKPGAAWKILSKNENAADPRAKGQKKLPHGCFIESVLAARRLTERGWVGRQMTLLMYYSPVRKAGHCVLVYEMASGVFVIDPGRDAGPEWISSYWPTDPVELARLTLPNQPKDHLLTARLLPLAVDTLGWAQLLGSGAGDRG